MHFPHSHRSSYYTVYREKDHKLIYHYHKKPEERYELFDLVKDPSEKNNLASTNKGLLQKMLNSMKKELENNKALYPYDKDKKNFIKPQ